MRMRRRNWLIIISMGVGLGMTQACSQPDLGTPEDSQVTKIEDTSLLKVSDLLADDVIDDSEQEAINYYSCDRGRNRGKKALVCHYPPGNGDNRHEICVSLHALKAHVGRHGDDEHRDHLGPCRDGDAGDGDGDGAGDGSDDGSGDGDGTADGSDPTCGSECEQPGPGDLTF